MDLICSTVNFGEGEDIPLFYGNLRYTANKELVERCVKLLLGLETEPKPDHAADALAGAITHINHS